MAIVKSLGIVGGIILALIIGAYLFLGAGQFFEEFKSIGYGLLALAIIIAAIVVGVFIYMMSRGSSS